MYVIFLRKGKYLRYKSCSCDDVFLSKLGIELFSACHIARYLLQSLKFAYPEHSLRS